MRRWVKIGGLQGLSRGTLLTAGMEETHCLTLKDVKRIMLLVLVADHYRFHLLNKFSKENSKLRWSH